MKLFAIIVAGGAGKRMNATVPKQFLLLKGRPVLMHAIAAFNTAVSQCEIIVVLPSEEIATWKQLCCQYFFTIKHQVVAGGDQRFHSVKNAIANCNEKGYIAVHDGARPLVSTDLIVRSFETARKCKSAVPVVSVEETIRCISGNSSVTVDRTKYKLVQTPQVFESNLLLDAYKQHYIESFTDDASVVEAFGYSVTLCEGEKNNIKITTPIDLIIAEAYLDA